MQHKHPSFSPESIRLIGAALALQQVTATAASITPIPNTERFVVIGTPAEVARLMEVAPASADNPSTAGAVLDSEKAREAFEAWYTAADNNLCSVERNGTGYKLAQAKRAADQRKKKKEQTA